MVEKKYYIAPSILSADLARLGQEVDEVLAAGADMIHIDVMDQHYVPNLTFGPIICQALRNYGIKALLDVHLMVSPVDQLIQDFALAGADHISFHPEASNHIDRSLQLIKKLDCKAGLVFNPATPISCLPYVLDYLDFVLVMSVNPGFGGQKFIPSALKKIVEIKNLAIKEGKSNLRIAVDGGIDLNTLALVAKAGADTFIAGSAIFGSKNSSQDYSSIIAKMRSILIQA